MNNHFFFTARQNAKTYGQLNKKCKVLQSNIHYLFTSDIRGAPRPPVVRHEIDAKQTIGQTKNCTRQTGN